MLLPVFSMPSRPKYSGLAVLPGILGSYDRKWRTEGPAVKRRIAIEDILDYLDTRTEDCQGMSLVGKENEGRSRCLMSSLYSQGPDC